MWTPQLLNIKQFRDCERWIFKISAIVLFLFTIILNDFCAAQESHSQTPVVGKQGTKCYDNFRRPQRCVPGFENAAFNSHITATNTCGDDGPIEYCIQTNPSESKRICQICRKGDHDSRFLTDIHSNDNQTWWQSETMYEGIQFPNQVNLTLSFGKSFDVTYIRLDFYSPRPESFSIYKRSCEECPWVPFQFFSLSCRDTYGAPNTQFAPPDEETRPLCTSEYSEMIPLTGGNVLFSTLQGRPSAQDFANSDELQDFVQATDIRISLDRLNTFGDEVFQDPRVLRSYFYAISDIAVGARCSCNGHAAECVDSTGSDGIRRRVCLCEHNTYGPDCNECLPFYNDAPWKRATTKDAHECKQCNCNGFSNRCIFDEELYNRTGHGGYCLECTANRDGPNCERCRENYYQQEDGFCRPCECNEIGSRSLQCDRKGQCQCKSGVTGTKCDRCADNNFDFGPNGCKMCGCLREGSLGNIQQCDPITGVCRCKENVEGKRCRECKPGFFNLDENNEFGCTPCFCYGHSSVCKSAVGYSQIAIHSFFDRSSERWTAQNDQGRNVPVSYNGLVQNIGVSAPDRTPVYFIAPERFLGDQRASYNKDFKFTLRIGENGASPTAADIILEGSGLYISNTIFGKDNKLPNTQNQEFKFRLHEHPDYKWHPRLSARAFMSILTNLTAIRIRGTYTPKGVGFLDDVRLESALRGAAGEPANWIEVCDCPIGYVGQFCESCAAGYRHSPALGGPFMQCEPCDCNKHADNCDSETGRCKCQHNTAGDNCELCARGYYGNALVGTKFDCKPCGCPNNGPCLQLPDEKLVCLECPTGYTGPQCDLCSDGYYGDPRGLSGTLKPCLPCTCNHNIDTNAVGNCNRTTGECLKCIYNTYGESCEQCLPGYYGNALAIPKGDCQPCSCYPPGTQESENGILICDQLSGQCLCKDHVLGRNCNECEIGYFNIESEEGCHPCNCDSIGSYNNTCDLRTGQCFCRPGVTGLRCDKCEEYKYGFSRDGCKSCDCDIIGSSGLQCDHTGQCPCRTNVEGKKCDRCKENKYDRQQGCIDCPPAYNLVQDAVHEHQDKLARLEEVLNGIKNNPTVIDGSDFDKKLKQVESRVIQLLEQAKEGAGFGGSSTLTEHIDEIKNRLQTIEELLNNINNMSEDVKNNVGIAHKNLTEAELITQKAKNLLDEALNVLNIQGKEALDKAIDKSHEYGHQNKEMESISREARKKADALESEAKHIQDLATKAENVSQLAYKTAKNAIDKQQQTSENIISLRNAIASIRDKLATTHSLTQNAKIRAQDAQREALKILNEIQTISIPQVNIRMLEKDTQWKEEEAKGLLEMLDKLEKENQEIIKSVLDLIDEANGLYENAENQQQTITELLSDADEAYYKAEDAVKKGNDTWEQAQKTYQVLSKFDNEVNKHKQAAKDALNEVEKIRDLIYNAETKTYEAKSALNNIYTNAQNAKISAENGQNLTGRAAENVNEIRKEANNLKSTAGKLRVEANDFAERVTETGNNLKKLEDQATNDKNLITEVKKKVGQAGKYSSEASNQVQKAVNDVQDIIDILNDLQAITPEKLDELEEKLKQAEAELKRADLDKRIQMVRDEKQTQAILIASYEKSVAQLQQEVAIIKDISESLPSGCFKRTKLEP